MAIAAVESRGQISIVAWRIGEPASVNHRPLNHATSPTAGVSRSLTHHIVVPIERQHVGIKRPLRLPRRERELLGQPAGHGDESGTEHHRPEKPTPGHVDLKRPGRKRDGLPGSRRALFAMVTIAFDDPPPERHGRSSSPRNPRRQATRRVLAVWPDGFLLAAPWGTAAPPPAPALNRGSTAGFQPRDLLPPGMLLPEAQYFTNLPV